MAEANETNEGKKKGNLKLILTVLVVVILAIAVSVAATLFFLGDQIGNASDDDGSEPEATEAAGPPETFYYRFDDPFVVSLGGERRERYMQIHLAVAMQENDVSAAIDEHGPTLRSRVRTLLARQDFDTIQSREAKEVLQQDLTTLINEVLEEEGVAAIDTVLYRNFVAQ